MIIGRFRFTTLIGVALTAAVLLGVMVHWAIPHISAMNDGFEGMNNVVGWPNWAVTGFQILVWVSIALGYLGVLVLVGHHIEQLVRRIDPQPGLEPIEPKPLPRWQRLLCYLTALAGLCMAVYFGVLSRHGGERPTPAQDATRR